MTWSEYIKGLNGYEAITTFWSDFSIADHFGPAAIQNTFDRAFQQWKGNYKYLTELVLVLNHKIWQHYETNETYGTLYNDLWEKADAYAVSNLEGEQLEWFYQWTD